jgi:ribonuclease R
MGFFVDVPGLSMSGLVPLSTMEDDFYVFDPVRNHLIGRRTRRIIRLGDNVDVQVAKVNTFKKQVDFRLTATSGRRPAFTPTGRVDQRRVDERGTAPATRGRSSPARGPTRESRSVPSSRPWHATGRGHRKRRPR